MMTTVLMSMNRTAATMAISANAPSLCLYLQPARYLSKREYRRTDRKLRNKRPQLCDLVAVKVDALRHGGQHGVALGLVVIDQKLLQLLVHAGSVLRH